MDGLKKFKQNTTFHVPVIIPSLIFIVLVAGICMLAPDWTQSTLNTAKTFVFQYFSWFYVLLVSLFLLFLLLLAMSRLGDIRLGSNEEEPEFPFLSWLAMLFAAGMGVGLMFFGVAEPLSHALNPVNPASPAQNAQNALLYTSYHWGIHAWTIYGTIALALAYFGFRYKLPLSLRSTFYPLLKDRINGPLGHAIDTIALCATLFGIITTLGYGAMQLTAGLHTTGWIKSDGFGTQTIVIITVVSIAVLSAISGVGKGVRRLSEINLVLAIGLMLFVLIAGPTLFLFSAFSDNIGYYLSNLVSLSFKSFAYEPDNQAWFSGWTVLYWAWWFSWAPFVGLFIARISRGRTIREFILSVLILPTLFNLIWFTIFGNSAIWANDILAQGALGQLTSTPEKLLFAFLDYFPLSSISSIAALMILALFFITSADSGIFVLNNIASENKNKAVPRWQCIMWGVIMIVVAIALLNSDGLGALQAMTLVVALPFSVIMLLMCVSLWQALRIDNQYYNTKLNPSSVYWTGEFWQKRLKQILKQPQKEDILRFIRQTALPAMQTLLKELDEKHGLTASIQKKHGETEAIEFIIEHDSSRSFIYGIRIQKRQATTALLEDDSLPGMKHDETYEPICYFGDGRQGYDVQYMREEELITDIIKQYERYLNLLDNESHQLMTQAPVDTP